MRRLLPRMVTGIGALLLSACAPFAVNWYHIHEPPPRSDVASAPASASEDKIEVGVRLVVINTTNEHWCIDSIRLHRETPNAEDGLVWHPNDAVSLSAGELMSVKLVDFKARDADPTRARYAACSVPMRIWIDARARCESSPTLLAIDLGKRPPATLPEAWTECTGRPAP